MKISHIFLLFFLRGAIGFEKETCPAQEDVAPCTCNAYGDAVYVFCKGGELVDVERALVHLQGKNVAELQLYKVDIKRLPSFFFWGQRVKSLKIEFCEGLEGLADADEKPALLGLEHSLEWLSIESSIKGDNKLATINLAHMKQLTKLSLTKNNIPEIGNDWFQNGPNSLESISIINCSLEVIGDQAFASLKNIDTLKFDGNPIKAFERSMIPKPAKHLRHLSLERTNVIDIPEDFFSGMQSLKYLYLRNNSIWRLPYATWSPVWQQLQGVDLRDNPLECDDFRIDWTFKLKVPVGLYGVCSHPPERKNKRLKLIITENKEKLVL